MTTQDPTIPRSSTPKAAAVTGIQYSRSSSAAAASAFFPAPAPGGEETMPHVTVLCATDNLTVCFTCPRDFIFQWLVPLALVSEHQRTRRIASTSREEEPACQRAAAPALPLSVPPGCRPGLCAGDLRFIQGEHCRDRAEMLLFSQVDISRALPSRTSLRLKDGIQPTGYCLAPAVLLAHHPRPRCTRWGKAGPGTARRRAGL